MPFIRIHSRPNLVRPRLTHLSLHLRTFEAPWQIELPQNTATLMQCQMSAAQLEIRSILRINRDQEKKFRESEDDAAYATALATAINAAEEAIAAAAAAFAAEEPVDAV